MVQKQDTKLTKEEKELIERLNDPLYTAEYVEHWINKDDNVMANPIAAMQAMGAEGYHKAVKNMIAAKEKG